MDSININGWCHKTSAIFTPMDSKIKGGGHGQKEEKEKSKSKSKETFKKSQTSSCQEKEKSS